MVTLVDREIACEYDSDMWGDMAVVSEKARVLYVVVPKAACTSIKTLFLKLDGGTLDAPRAGLVARMLGREKTGPRSVHQIPGYVTQPFSAAPAVRDGFERITVLRDPLARLHSAWSNKATAANFARRGETEALQSVGLKLNPTFGEFLDRFERYSALSGAVAVHSRSLAWHLGETLGWYDRLFRLEALGEFESYISERVGMPVRLGRENAGGHEPRTLGFEPRHVDVARRLLAEDYTLLDGHYDFDTGLAAFSRKHALAL